MKAAGFALVAIAVLIAYEALQHLKATAKAAPTGGTGGGGAGGGSSSSGTFSESSSTLSALPSSFVNAVSLHESGNNPPPGTNNYFGNGVSRTPIAGWLGPFTSGEGGIPIWEKPYASYQDAVAAFTENVTTGVYAPAYQRYQTSGDICQFVNDIAPMYESGSVTPTAASYQWASNIRSLIGC